MFQHFYGSRLMEDNFLSGFGIGAPFRLWRNHEAASSSYITTWTAYVGLLRWIRLFSTKVSDNNSIGRMEAIGNTKAIGNKEDLRAGDSFRATNGLRQNRGQRYHSTTQFTVS
jgi:hypothetical protein